ncbi:MAG: PAS domain-containing protein, partial [Actinomycetia bacterium]|nr:PAS domain-containing protein [Actinomycetes bacterium]
EHRLLLKGGTLKYVKEHGETFYNKFGKPVRSIGMVHDMTRRKIIENQLRESEVRYKKILDSQHSGVMIIDPDTFKIIDINKKGAEIIGLEKEKIIGKVCRKFICSPGKWKCPVVDLGEKIHSSERVIKKRNGDLIPIYKTIDTITLNKKEYLIESFVDITEQKAAKLKLQKSEERFRSIVEETEAGYFFIDWEGIIRDVNDAWIKMYKYNSVEEVLNKHFKVIHRIDGEKKFREIFDGIMKGDERYMNGEFSRKCKDGSVGYHTFSARQVVVGGAIIGIDGFIIDCTKRKKAELALRESEEKARAILAATTDLIVSLDRKGRIVDINNAQADFFGKSRDEMLSKSFWSYFKKEDTKRLKIILKNIFKSGKSTHSVDRIDINNEIKIFDIIGYPIFNDEGNV